MSEKFELPPILLGMVFDYYFSPVEGAYTHQYIWSLEEKLDIGAFETAWRKLIDRHEILRTGFDLFGKQGIIHQQYQFNIKHFDWSKIPIKQRQKKFDQFLHSDRQQRLDLSIAPPFRVTLIKLATRSYKLCWTYHHVSFDGCARFLLVKELFSLYQALLHHQKVNLPSVTPFRQCIDLLINDNQTAANNYWHELFAGFRQAPQLNLWQLANKPDKYRNLDQRQIHLNETFHQAIKQCAKQYDVTVSTLMQAAWILSLSKLCQTLDVTIGVARTCRSRSFSNAENIIGLLVNVVPIRLQIQSDWTLQDTLTTLRQQWLAMRPHFRLSLNEIKRSFDYPTSKQLFNTALNFDTQGESEELQNLGDEWKQRSFHKIDNHTVDLELDIKAYNGIDMVLEFSENRFDCTAIDKFMQEMVNMLHVLRDSLPDRPIKELLAIQN